MPLKAIQLVLLGWQKFRKMAVSSSIPELTIVHFKSHVKIVLSDLFLLCPLFAMTTPVKRILKKFI
ncbi:MAG: hypothetical protein Q6370_007860 [Candidatus Sigynarchaeota archaeon]